MPQRIVDAYQSGFILITSPNRRDKSPKDAGEWADGPYNYTQGEEAMWRAVIMQALMDACARWGRHDWYVNKLEAIRWLTSGGEDFLDVCERASLDHNFVRVRAKKAMANPGAWRTEAGVSERYLERHEMRKRLRAERADKRIRQAPEQAGCVIYNIFA